MPLSPFEWVGRIVLVVILASAVWFARVIDRDSSLDAVHQRRRRP
jgi:hypothetical protein